MLLERFYRNHVLANLLFVLVLVVGALSYAFMPREQDPTINFNWVVITTVLPGAAAGDIEKRVTDPLEDAIRNIADIKFVSSNSREGVSSILVRFESIDERVFDKRVTDLRREIQNKEDELPDEAEDSVILEITSSNAFPTATLAVAAKADDDNLRYHAHNIKKDLERISGVDRVEYMGLNDPELQVLFHPDKLVALGVSPVDLANTVAAFFRDTAAGSVRVADENWLVRVVGTSSEPGYLSGLPILGAQGEVPLGSVAEVVRGREKATTAVSYLDRPAISRSVMKKGDANMLTLMDRIKQYLTERNRYRDTTGVELVLVDDQTVPTRQAIGIMQNNALLGLLFVLLVTWAFLGTRIALLVTIGIPFILAGTFWILANAGHTLNVTVLLGTVISLGMLVDDAVVVVEAIYYRLQRGEEVLQAALNSLREVFAPVTTAVLTTMAAFLPLMLLPGILGEFMRVIPIVVTTALAISLIEAYWMLPAHVTGARISFDRPSRVHKRRRQFTHWIQINYTRLLLRVMRYPKSVLGGLFLLFVLATAAVSSNLIKKDFFASDPIRLFYVNIEMPPATSLQGTLDKAREIEAKVRSYIRDGEARAIISYSGQLFTETSPLLGDFYGQVLIGLSPKVGDMREVDDVIDAMREDVLNTPGPVNLSFLRLAGGPPTAKPISIKVRGDDYPQIRAAADALKQIIATVPGAKDLTDDASRGRMELVLRMDHDAVRRAELSPADISRALRLKVDGEVVASMQHLAQELDVRVRAEPRNLQNVEWLLDETLPAPDGRSVPLRELFHYEVAEGLGNIRHYNFRRAITVEADLDKEQIDTVDANERIAEGWEKIAANYPSIDLDFSGELDDIQESIDAMFVLFVFGVGLMYLIVGTQFRSYFQPLMILVTVPMAFTGVVLGLIITQNPLSLFTMYGVVALGGIAVNAAIVLISAANVRLAQGMTVLHATVYAARRRVIPILITSLTTIAGLFSLATGLGGQSLVWGPVATAIVWGLAFSTILTLLVIPLLFRLSMNRAARRMRQART
ncbi:MAG: efflux RND transporter permease subunit [Pseudomonadota bacterium]|nr:MAG: efflux RND transporter permease subunit [Pseudomonadota bacterium]